MSSPEQTPTAAAANTNESIRLNTITGSKLNVLIAISMADLDGAAQMDP